MSLDLNKLENKLDAALQNETSETLNNWLNNKRMTNNKQQTAVNSIVEFCQKQMDNDSSIHKGVYYAIIKFCQEQGKEMEKDQMIKSILDNRNITSQVTFKDAEQYYEETYGGGEQ